MPPTLANGKICYIEMPATDIARSADFYRRVFGWNIRKRGDGSTAFDDTTGEVSGTWMLGRPPDRLNDGPRSAPAIAAAIGAHAPTLQRLLHALTSVGVFTESSMGYFQNTELSDILRADHPIRASGVHFSPPLGSICGMLADC